MRRLIDEAYGELENYLSDYDISSVLNEPDFRRKYRAAFKRLYPLLLWKERIDERAVWQNKEEKNNVFCLYYNETVSDLLQSYFISQQGLYKPSFLILRSGVENYLRCLGIAYDQHVLALTSAYDLVDVVKSLDIFSGTGEPRRHFLVLRQKYKDLCDYVHTSDATYMSLHDIVGVFPRYDDERSSDFFDAFHRIAVAINSLNLILLQPVFRSMPHRFRDLILDTVPKPTKRMVFLE